MLGRRSAELLGGICLLGLIACGPSTSAPPSAEGSGPDADGSRAAIDPVAIDGLGGSVDTGVGAVESGESHTDLDRIDRRAYEHLAGDIAVDGSSTVFPITEAVALLFAELAPAATVHLGVSGTGGGFDKFCRGETDISNASRPIKAKEKERCQKQGIDFVELPVAFDGVSLVVHGTNGFCECLTVDELRRLWRPEAQGRIERWSDLRSEWPERKIHLFAPGRDSGTFDYFTSAVVGDEGLSRPDFVGSEDDYLLAQDISADPDALGFFGFAYYREYRDRLGLLAVDPGSGCVRPSETSIAEGTYRPLSRPIFVYARVDALERREVARFLDLYLDRAARLVPEVGYVALPERAYGLARQRLATRITGSMFGGGSEVGLSIEKLLEMESLDGDQRGSNTAPEHPVKGPGTGGST